MNSWAPRRLLIIGRDVARSWAGDAISMRQKSQDQFLCSIPPPFAHGHPIHNHNVILCYVYNVHILTLNTIITLNQSRTIPAIYCILFTHTECKLQPAPMLERNTVLENSAHSPLIWQFVVQVSQGCSLRSSCSGLTLLIKVLLINSNTCPYPMFVYFSVFPASRIFVINQATHNI